MSEPRSSRRPPHGCRRIGCRRIGCTPEADMTGSSAQGSTPQAMRSGSDNSLGESTIPSVPSEYDGVSCSGAKPTSWVRPGPCLNYLGRSSDSNASQLATPKRVNAYAKSRSTAALLQEGQAAWWVVGPQESSKTPASQSTGQLRDPSSQASRTELQALSSSGSTVDSVGSVQAPKRTFCGESPAPSTGHPTTMWKRGVFGFLRRKCSMERNRYEQDGFDLDLTYVTSRVVAMSFPAAGREALYRNPRASVARYLRQAHGDRFRIYNLCNEESYMENGFPEQTVRFPCLDHCPPTLKIIWDFCKDVQAWLQSCDDNVVVVHCKAGKGRTGTMIASLLIFAGAFSSAYEALLWYERMRGGKNAGVTIPDQIKWVSMLERYLSHKCEGLASDPMGAPVPHRLLTVRLGPFPSTFLRPAGGCGSTQGDGTCIVSVFLVSRADVEQKRKFTYRFPEITVCCNDGGYVEVELAKDVCIWRENDGVLEVHVAPRTPGVMPSRKSSKLVRVWWHHAFLQRHGAATQASGEARSPSSVTPSSHSSDPPWPADNQEELLELKVPKVWVRGMHKDCEKNRKAPAEFQIRALFQDVHEGQCSRRI